MKVALVHYAAPPVVGGVESVLARHARLMTDAGHQVRILSGRGQTWDTKIPVEVIPLFDSRHPDVLRLKSNLDKGEVPPEFGGLVEDILVRLQLALSGVDVVIVHNVASLHKNLALTTALYQLAQSPGAPRFVLWHHDLAWTTPRYQAEIHPGWPWDLLRIPWPGARQVVVSQSRRTELAALMHLDPERIAVVPNGVDLPMFYSLQPETMALLKLLPDLEDAAPLLLTPVRLTRRKNIEMGLNILARLRESLPRAMLVVTGPPGAHNPANLVYFEELKALREKLKLNHAAHFLAEFAPDGLSDVQIADFYRIADVLLITSREEGFGIPILEAGLGRLPIFSSDLEPLRALADGRATFFDLNASPEKVAARMAKRLAKDQVYQMRIQVRDHYTWGAIYKVQIAPLLEER